MNDDRPLTLGQLEVIVLIANGLRPVEIANKIYRSESWVRQSLVNSQRRAGAKTIPHLVSIVIASGVLEWVPENEERKIRVAQGDSDESRDRVGSGNS